MTNQSEFEEMANTKITEIITTVISKETPVCIFVELPHPITKEMSEYLRSTFKEQFQIAFGFNTPPFPLFILGPGARITAIPCNEAGAMIINERWGNES